MNQAVGRPAGEIARGLAYVCEHRKYIESAIVSRPAAERAALIRLTHADGSTDVAADLETIHKALRSAGDGKGIFNRDRTFLRPVGVDQDDSEPVLRCPRQDRPCTRFAQPGPGADPRCALTGKALARGELNP